MYPLFGRKLLEIRDYIMCSINGKELGADIKLHAEGMGCSPSLHSRHRASHASRPTCRVPKGVLVDTIAFTPAGSGAPLPFTRFNSLPNHKSRRARVMLCCVGICCAMLRYAAVGVGLGGASSVLRQGRGTVFLGLDTLEKACTLFLCPMERP